VSKVRKVRAGKARENAGDSDSISLEVYGLSARSAWLLTLLCVVFALFTLVPLAWIVINSTKDETSLFNSFGFWFAKPFSLFTNLGDLGKVIDGGGPFVRWLGNTVGYALVAGIGSAVLSALAGYGFARFKFRGVRALFFFVIAALLVPITAITLPLYLVYAHVGLINSIWGMILPSLVTPVGVYLMRTFIDGSVPQELLDAARVDGAGELRIFFRLVVPIVIPGFMAVTVINIVGVWNNFFLPLLIFSKNSLYPLTVGINLWTSQAQVGGNALFFPLVVAGGLVTVLPLVVLFLVMQRYIRGGMVLGSLAN